VKIIEYAERLLPFMDKEVSQNLSMIFKKRGIEISTGTAISDIDGIDAEAVVVAAGRMACTHNNAFIPVNEYFQTDTPNIYAIGDVTGGAMLAHAASAQGIAAVDHMLGKPCPINLDVIPSCIYTSPEIAQVGMTADEAKKRGIPHGTAKYIMSANGKSLIENEERGFIKLIYNPADNVILGATLMCGRASDLIAAAALAVANGLTADCFKKTIFPHPTFCEGFGEVVKGI
jgi:dihydrolipoamide dehydrogenase